MAVSDPNPDVPTPTGTLAGLAAFAWDGSAWQPSGRAMPSVATPTGVLRGVAPFSWNGSAWVPSGAAMPSVATPSGVLDGVALYTWNGSAWTPSGGVPDVATPSGVLRGVAGFYFDGTNWQPAGQAAPEVAVPGGVLAGAAMFQWNGAAWTAAPSLDLNFLTGTLDSRITFTRASMATYFDATGTLQTAGNNVARFDHDPNTLAAKGLLIEEARTNLLLNSATLSTQSVAVTAQAYTLSFQGTGSVTLSGTSTGTTNGTGASNRVTSTFTPTAGTLTLTVSGSVTNAQLEAGAFATSYIPTTGATATRAAEVATMPVGSWFVQRVGSLAGECIFPASIPASAFPIIAEIDDNTSNNRISLLGTSSNIVDLVVSGGTTEAQFNQASPTLLATYKTAVSYAANAQAGVANGGTVSTATGTTMPTGLTQMQLGNFGGGSSLNGYLRRVRYWPRALSSTELQQATT